MAYTQSGVNQRAATFFAQLVAGYHQAASRSQGATQLTYEIGGQRVRIGYASQMCAETFAPALQHLCCSPGATVDQEAAFTIWVWDCASTAMPPVHAPWSLADYLPNRMVRGFCDERFRTITYHDQAICLMIDLAAQTAVYWRRDMHETLDYERAAPFRELFCWWMATRGRYFVHGGAVDGIFLAGVGGAGKSTTALACLLHGVGWVGEDYVLLADEEQPYAYSLYCTAKLGENSLRLLPAYRESVMLPADANQEKALLQLYPRYAAAIRPRVPLRAVVLPVVGERAQPRLAPMAGAAIFRPVFSSTVKQIPSADPTLLTGMAAVLRQLPCYQLELSPDLRQVIACLHELREKRE